MPVDNLPLGELGRNDPCPICGVKMKRCPGHGRHFPWAWVVVRIALPMFALGAVILSFRLTQYRPNTAPTADWEARVAASEALIQGFADRKPPDAWWLASLPDLEDPLARDALVAATAERQHKVHTLLQRYRGVSPLSGQIAAAFPESWVSMFHRGVTVAVMAGQAEPRGIEVCFVPRDQQGHNHPSHFYYHTAMGGLMLAALEYPDGVLAGFLFHELGHGLRHRQGEPSATAPPASDAYIGEEVQMHQLETDVLDAVAGGSYSAILDGILARLPAAKNPQEAILKLTEADLRALDGAIGADTCGPTISHALTAQYALSLGLRYLQRTAAPEQLFGAQVELYRWFIRTHAGVR